MQIFTFICKSTYICLKGGVQLFKRHIFGRQIFKLNKQTKYDQRAE